MEKNLEIEADKLSYDNYNRMKLVNIVQTLQKNAEKRSIKEKEYLILYMRLNFDIFRDVDKKDLGVISKRLSLREY